MAKAKEGRNEAIWRDLEAGMTRKELCQKYKMTMSSLKSQIRRMRERKGLLGDTSKLSKVDEQAGKPASQQVKKLVSKETSKQKYETVSYYITKEMKWKIKALAAGRQKEISEIIREIFKEYFDKH